MTLPHQAGLDRQTRPRPDSLQSAEEHARGHSYLRPGRVEWTTGNIARLVALVAISVAVVVGMAMWGIGLSSTDPSTPHGAANAYFAALQSGDEGSASRLECARMYNTDDRDIVAEALRKAPDNGPAFAIGPGSGNRSPYFLPFMVDGKVRGVISVEQVRDEERFMVCDFFHVQVRRQ